MRLRPYQTDISNKIDAAWQLGCQNVLAVAPCGSGKTAIFSNKLALCPDACVAIAHRQELVSQMSLTLARYGISHRIIGPMNVIKWVIQLHTQVLGRDYYDANARRAVAGVDTLISWSKPESRHHDALMRWAKQVKLWVLDEGHHGLADNKWGAAVKLFPNARGLSVTATAERADGKGLGRHADGLIDTMVDGVDARWLISQGYLTDYRVICPPSNLRLADIPHGADGDFIRKRLATATRSSSIMGDVAKYYLEFARGKLGVTFAPDVETATELAARFNQAGVPAEVVSAKTPDSQRVAVLQRFAAKKVLQLVNVDLFGEGFDLPAIEVVSMARATDSYPLYHQQFMRALRPLEGKDKAIIIDHVGNIRHGLPDAPRVYTLDRREGKGSSKQEGVIPLRVCTNPVCMSPYERVLLACPFCGHVPVPAQRSAPEFVDGDLYELDPATLAAMRGEVERVDKHPDTVLRWALGSGKSQAIAHSIANRHEERQRAQTALREAIMWYGGARRAAGENDRIGQRRFYHTFGVDVLSAQTLGRPEAEQLTERINRHIGRV